MRKIQEPPTYEMINRAPHVFKPNNKPCRTMNFQQTSRKNISLPKMIKNENILEKQQDTNKSKSMSDMKLPITPRDVFNFFYNQLTKLEINQIKNFKNIWYIGTYESKIKTDKEDDYNDNKRYYRAMPNDEILFRYQIISTIGQGSFSSVYKCIDHFKKRLVAVKIIRDSPDCLHFAELESAIQNSINSPYSVKIYNSFYWRGHLCFSMELMNNDLFHYILTSKNYNFHPNIVKGITFQLLLGLKELRQKHIVHADLKPENILTTDNNFTTIKISDYGTACFEHTPIFSYIQSRFYRAPEITLELEYGTPIDIWSLGCIVYELLMGRPLFPAKNELELFNMMLNILGPVPKKVYEKSSRYSVLMNKIDEYKAPNSKNLTLKELTSIMPKKISYFIQRCLTWDPSDRITPNEALSLEWFTAEIKNFDVFDKQRSQSFTPKSARRSIQSQYGR